MKGLTWFLLALLTVPSFYAKPKVDVRVKVIEETDKDRVTGKLSNGPASSVDMFQGKVFFMNVTVLSDNAEAVAKNNGQWCISGDTALDLNGEYQGALYGNTLEIQVPGKNGKIKKLQFEVFDHKWRKLSDIE